MLFNSIEFVFFLPVVFGIYWFIVQRELKLQNLFLLAASYFFYGWWDWRFLSLVFFSTVADFLLGKWIGQTTNKQIQKRYLWASLLINLGILGFFKYYNFFVAEFARFLDFIGLQANYSSLNIILPIGISFYTFQTLSYTIDIYKERIRPTSDFVAFAAFVSFFPQLVAGPVERAKALLPQFLKEREFNYDNAVDGCQQILWGFFKKIVIADNCAIFVNDIFGYHQYSEVSGIILIAGAILFVIQIYADFSGYSDIAIGVASLFGFKLMQNFNYPYFATSITEFWRRWNISVSTWFRDYLNQPLLIEFRHWGATGVFWALFLTFAIMGLWHGAGWNFIFYGIIHGLVMVVELYSRKKRKQLRKKMPDALFMLLAWTITMTIWTISLIFFRAESMNLAVQYIVSTFNNLFIFDYSQIVNRVVLKSLFITMGKVQVLTFAIIIMFIIEWIFRKEQYGLKLSHKKSIANWSIYILILFIILLFGEFNQQEFIYFQF